MEYQQAVRLSFCAVVLLVMLWAFWRGRGGMTWGHAAAMFALLTVATVAFLLAWETPVERCAGLGMGYRADLGLCVDPE